MKKIFKKSNILSFLLGAIIFGGIGTVVAATIMAQDVTYTPRDTTWNVDNVEDAIDDLYEREKNNIKLDQTTTATSNKILNGFTAYNNSGELITGTLPTYNGTTIFNPTTSSQTISTSGKYMNDDIVINGMDVTYKNLTEQTTVTANALLYGVIAYNQSGQTVTGNIETYSGNTTVTPTESQQTISTNGKYLNSDITIDAIPSKYKDIGSTTVDANNLLSGYTAYNKNGELITGNISTDCISGTFTVTTAATTSSGQVLFDFNPSKFFMIFKANHQVVFYNPTYTNDNKVYFLEQNKSWADASTVFTFKDGKYYGINWSSVFNNTNVHYIACK